MRLLPAIPWRVSRALPTSASPAGQHFQFAKEICQSPFRKLEISTGLKDRPRHNINKHVINALRFFDILRMIARKNTFNLSVMMI
jgi:hypothetical protein